MSSVIERRAAQAGLSVEDFKERFGPWTCAICGGETSDARIYIHHDGTEIRVHPYPYRPEGKLFSCEFIAKRRYERNR